MTNEIDPKIGSDARERVLQEAEILFHERGYQTVSMRDVADALGMRQASLYYHVPDGKEQLFVEVMERSLYRHRRGIDHAIAAAGPDLQAQLRGVADWLTTNPALRLSAMVEADMPALSEENAERLMRTVYRALFQPLIGVFAAAVERGETRPLNPERLAGMFLTLLDGIKYVHHAGHTAVPTQLMADEIIDILLNGIRPYPQPNKENT